MQILKTAGIYPTNRAFCFLKGKHQVFATAGYSADACGAATVLPKKLAGEANFAGWSLQLQLQALQQLVASGSETLLLLFLLGAAGLLLIASTNILNLFFVQTDAAAKTTGHPRRPWCPPFSAWAATLYRSAVINAVVGFGWITAGSGWFLPV